MTRFLKLGLVVFASLLLAGCESLIVMNPSGDVARQQADLIIYSVVLMLIVIVPVMVLTVFFAIHYRDGNKKARYEPEWSHSISLEIVIWSVPLAIIICLAGLTWVATHRLNPFDSLTRISETQPMPADADPMVVQVVAMDWKWLFIYPEENIASVNEMAAIVDRPIEFQISSTTVMNALYVPELAGMIYAMPGMQSELNAVINKSGVFEGFSANYSGAGFSKMRFDFHALDDAGFDSWVEQVRAGGSALDDATLADLDKASIDHPVTYYNSVEDTLWEKIVNLCVGDQDLCLNDMMMVDALGGGGLEGLYNRELFRGLCSADDPEALMALIRPELRGKQDEILAAMSLESNPLIPAGN